MNTELSDRFINAFCQLEEELRKITGAANFESFSFLLDHAARRNPAFAHYRDDLKEYAELRNAIVHKRLGDKPIAEPHPDIVEHIESIAKIITDAPRLGDHFRKHVAVCSQQDLVTHILALLRSGKFNQLPVYNGKKLVGLLTSDSFVLWLADSFQNSNFVDSNARVKDLIAYGSNKDDYVVLGASNSIFDALDAFETSYQRGKYLKAIIITENGNTEQHPIGIITTLEIPRLIGLLHPKPIAPIKPRH